MHVYIFYLHKWLYVIYHILYVAHANFEFMAVFRFSFPSGGITGMNPLAWLLPSFFIWISL